MILPICVTFALVRCTQELKKKKTSSLRQAVSVTLQLCWSMVYLNVVLGYSSSHSGLVNPIDHLRVVWLFFRKPLQLSEDDASLRCFHRP